MPSMDEIYREHSKTIYRYLLSLTHDADVSEELTQETFYQAVKSIDRYDESCKMTTWLCAIAKNSLAVYRRKHPVTDDLSELPDTVASAESETLNALGQVELLRALHALAGDKLCPQLVKRCSSVGKLVGCGQRHLLKEVCSAHLSILQFLPAGRPIFQPKP